jgi:hypothetical protein
VNETAEDAVRRVCVDGVSIDVPVRAFGARMGLVDRRKGELLAATPGAAIRRVAGGPTTAG